MCSERKHKVISFCYLACCVIYRLFPGLPPPWMCSNGSECFGRECSDCCLAHTIQWELFLLSAKTTAWKYVLLRHFAVWKCSRNWFHGCKSRIIMSSLHQKTFFQSQMWKFYVQLTWMQYKPERDMNSLIVFPCMMLIFHHWTLVSEFLFHLHENSHLSTVLEIAVFLKTEKRYEFLILL